MLLCRDRPKNRALDDVVFFSYLTKLFPPFSLAPLRAAVSHTSLTRILHGSYTPLFVLGRGYVYIYTYLCIMFIYVDTYSCLNNIYILTISLSRALSIYEYNTHTHTHTRHTPNIFFNIACCR